MRFAHKNYRKIHVNSVGRAAWYSLINAELEYLKNLKDPFDHKGKAYPIELSSNHPYWSWKVIHDKEARIKDDLAKLCECLIDDNLTKFYFGKDKDVMQLIHQKVEALKQLK